MNIFQKLQINKIASAFVLGAFLLIVTVYNSGDRLNATANNSMSNQVQNNTSLPSDKYLAAANKSETTYPSDDNQLEGLIYSDSNKVESLDNVNDFVSPQTQKALKDPGQIPAIKQPIIDRSNPDNKLFEKTGQMFEDAGNFSAN